MSHLFREGVKQNNYFFSSLLLLRGEGGVGGDVKELLGFFINQVFVGVFQYDSGTQNSELNWKNVWIFLKAVQSSPKKYQFLRGQGSLTFASL